MPVRKTNHLSDALGFLKFGWRKLFITILLIMTFVWFGIPTLFFIEYYISASIIVTLIDKVLVYTNPKKKLPEWHNFDFRILIVSIILCIPLIFPWLTLTLIYLNVNVQLFGLPFGYWLVFVSNYLYPLFWLFMGLEPILFMVIGASFIILSIIVGIIPSAFIVYFFDKFRKKLH